MDYDITTETRIHNRTDDWFFQFNVDDYGTVDISYYELREGKETQIGRELSIPKDCLETFISVLQKYND